MNIYDVIIIGGGFAGLTSAIYCARAGLKTLIVEKKYFGGQIVNTDKVENYPGYTDISGSELINNTVKQLDKFGVEMLTDEVISIDFRCNVKTLYTQNRQLKAYSVIISTGASPKKAGFVGENEFIGKGVSYCATCDGFFFKNKDVFVIGGGYSAVQESMYLSNIANSITMVVRKDKFRCSENIVSDLMAKPNVKICYNTEVVAVSGKEYADTILLKNNKTNDDYEIHHKNGLGVFVYAGYAPETSLFEDVVDLDSYGYIKSDENCNTNIEGVYAAGDVKVKDLRQLVTAASDGAIVAKQVEEYLKKACRI